MMVTLKLPYEVNQAIKHLSNAFKSMFPNSPPLMNSAHNLTNNLPPISCMVWNVQGAGSRDFMNALREVVRTHKPSVLSLVETHMGGEHAMKIAKMIGYTGHIRVDAQGFSGGIWVFWKPELVTIDPIDKHNQYITMLITRNGEIPWYLTAIYASPDPTKRQELWRNLEEFAFQNNKPWILAGDFNETRFGWERNSSSADTTRRSSLFNAWVDSNQLLEVEFSGPSHTWARGNSVDTRRSARLDRALCNSEWGLLFDKARVKHLPAIQSDHCPLLISSNGFAPLCKINRPFRFQAAWLTHEKFRDFLIDKWNQTAPLIPHLKSLSSDLQHWNKETFYNIFRQKRWLLARIGGIQTQLSKGRNSSLLKMEASLRRELDIILDQEEVLWYQKARVDWLKDGDRNTTFFHLSTVVRRWRNRISAIKNSEGEWVYDKDQVKAIVVAYFAKLFTDDNEEVEYNIPTGVSPHLSNEDWNILNRRYTKSDIDCVIKHMGSLKAPGPDGYQALFYQKNWDVIGPNVYSMVLAALEGKGLPPTLNETFLVLIPKLDNPEMASQFRPIGLCNVTYKIITKAIVNRIKLILPHITSNTQTSFVPGRQITDNIVIVQEVLHTMKRKQGQKGFMTLKIDFEKAYDRLKWSFIRDTLNEFNFPLIMNEVIMECISSPSMRILWNGEQTESFSPTRGIRQGDPLSPYLFVLCMERLNQIIEESILAGKWKPIQISRGGPQLTNLFFADDIILFSEASVEQALIIAECLDRFCMASGQKVSLQKSSVFFSNNVSDENKMAISQALKMEVTTDMGRYLGMPTLTSRVTCETFKHLCEKVDRKLSGWKSKYLSMAGRITLAKTTISSLACYSMQTAKIPRTICDNIDKKTRRFIWGGSDEKRKIHLLSWETLQLPRNQGGVGLRSARQANSAFLTKLGWRVLTEPNALWSRVLRYKYCKGRCDIDMFTPTSTMSNVWRGITENAQWLRKGTSTAIGNGKKTLFWDHIWATDTHLRELAIAPIPPSIDGSTVCEMWEAGGEWKWDEFANLLPQETLQKIASHRVVEDPLIGDLHYWKGSPNGEFSIKNAIKIISNGDEVLTDFKWELAWKTKVQQRVRTFLWLALHNRLLCNANRLV